MIVTACAATLRAAAHRTGDERSCSQARIPMPGPAIFQTPGDSEWRAMTSSGITYAEGVYRLGEYRYDRLADALAYARLQR